MLKILVLLDVTACSLVDNYNEFCPEDGSNKFQQIVGDLSDSS
jgi:hypothetical protein